MRLLMAAQWSTVMPSSSTSLTFTPSFSTSSRHLEGVGVVDIHFDPPNLKWTLLQCLSEGEGDIPL